MENGESDVRVLQLAGLLYDNVIFCEEYESWIFHPQILEFGAENLIVFREGEFNAEQLFVLLDAKIYQIKELIGLRLRKRILPRRINPHGNIFVGLFVGDALIVTGYEAK